MSFSPSTGRALAVPGLLLLLILAAALSLLVGAKPLPAAVIVDALSGTCQSADCTIVLDARLPRTLAGLLAGAALGLAGALMQTLTRNPLADPGILGVNSGASFAIVLGAALFGFSSPVEQLMMAFCGALAASLLVAFTGSQGGGQLSPVRLTLAGVALGAVLEGLSNGIALLNPDVWDQPQVPRASRISFFRSKRSASTPPTIRPINIAPPVSVTESPTSQLECVMAWICTGTATPSKPRDKIEIKRAIKTARYAG